jgi:anti-anti-sigma regulatory factor
MPERFSTLHLQGWTVVRVSADLDHAAGDALTEAVEAELEPGGSLVLDLKHHRIDDDIVDTLLDAAAEAASADATFAVVAEDERTRTTLRDAGLARVHESLDDALRVTARPRGRRAASGGPTSRMAPSSTDAYLPREDLRGPDET